MPVRKEITLIGYTKMGTGYAYLADQIREALAAAGWEVHHSAPHPATGVLQAVTGDLPRRGWPHLICLPPESFHTAHSKAANIGFTMFEAYPLPERFTHFMGQMDALVTPSQFCAEIFMESLQSSKVEVCRTGFNRIEPVKGAARLKWHRDFNFLSVFQPYGYDWEHERKNGHGLVEAFLDEFDGDSGVTLTIKAHLQKNQIEELTGQVLRRKNPPPIMIVNRAILDMGPFYAMHSAFILPTRGEAICYPALEAAWAGLPVAITRAGGQTEYLDENSTCWIPTFENPSQSEHELFKGRIWRESRQEDIRSAMRGIVEDWKTGGHENAARATKQKAFISQWTWEDFGARMDSILCRLLS